MGGPLKEEERVRFAYDEEMPRIDWKTQPKLETANWPEERRLRTYRSYAMGYVQTMLPVLQDLLGAKDAQTEMGRVARLVGLQFHEETARDLDLPDRRRDRRPRERAPVRPLAGRDPRR
jgi:hypothetical protein